MMPPLIHRDQSGFIKGRHIQHPLMMMYDLQETVTELDFVAYATLIDFEKAYDRVSWEYLWAVLRHFGFGERFVQWVRLMYTASEVQLNVNGHLFDAIRPSRGVKQGDPLSPLLFVLAMEPLCCAIQKRTELGLHLPGLAPATGMYFADDATLLSDSLTGAERQLVIVQRYCAASGAKLNIYKTTTLALNRTQTRHAPSYLWALAPDESVRYLELPVGQGVKHSDRLATIDAKFFAQFLIRKWWAKTMQKRIVIARTLMASQLWYCSPVTCIPEATIKSLQRALNSYVVRAKTEPSKGPLVIAEKWLYIIPGRTKLRLPNVERFIQRQRLNLLQQLVLASGQQSAPFGWYSIPLQQLTALPPPFDTDAPVLDFLWMPLSRQWFATRFGILTSWWVEVMTTWHAWTKTLNIETLSSSGRQRLLLTAPLWVNKYQQWRYQTEAATNARDHCGSRRTRQSIARSRAAAFPHSRTSSRLTSAGRASTCSPRQCTVRLRYLTHRAATSSSCIASSRTSSTSCSCTASTCRSLRRHTLDSSRCCRGTHRHHSSATGSRTSRRRSSVHPSQQRQQNRRLDNRSVAMFLPTPPTRHNYEITQADFAEPSTRARLT